MQRFIVELLTITAVLLGFGGFVFPALLGDPLSSVERRQMDRMVASKPERADQSECGPTVRIVPVSSTGGRIAQQPNPENKTTAQLGGCNSATGIVRR